MDEFQLALDAMIDQAEDFKMAQARKMEGDLDETEAETELDIAYRLAEKALDVAEMMKKHAHDLGSSKAMLVSTDDGIKLAKVLN